MYIKIYSTLIFLLISCSSFFYQKNVDKLDITGVKVTQVFPSLNINGSLEGYDTITAYIYYYRNMNLFKLPYHFTSEVNGVVAKSEIRYHYFVYEDGNSFGYDYDINKYPQGKQMSEDSLFKNEWIRQTKLYPIISTNNATLISRHQNKDSGILNEVYSIKGKTDTTLSGTVIFKLYR